MRSHNFMKRGTGISHVDPLKQSVRPPGGGDPSSPTSSFGSAEDDLEGFDPPPHLPLLGPGSRLAYWWKYAPLPGGTDGDDDSDDGKKRVLPHANGSVGIFGRTEVEDSRIRFQCFLVCSILIGSTIMWTIHFVAFRGYSNRIANDVRHLSG